MDYFDRVKMLVKEKTSLTLRAFIESMGINYETYNSGKRLKNLPRADESVRIAQALGVSVEYLVTGDKPDNSPHIETIEKYLDKISKELKEIK
jgi:transcriptional regulator with XRE-family HTH domain